MPGPFFQRYERHRSDSNDVLSRGDKLPKTVRGFFFFAQTFYENNFFSQLIMLSSTRYYAEGSIIADSRELSQGVMVITSGHVGVELPMDSAEADEENKKPDGRTLLYVLKRGCVKRLPFWNNCLIPC
jgi:hypothetical protein